MPRIGVDRIVWVISLSWRYTTANELMRDLVRRDSGNKRPVVGLQLSGIKRRPPITKHFVVYHARLDARRSRSRVRKSELDLGFECTVMIDFLPWFEGGRRVRYPKRR